MRTEMRKLLWLLPLFFGSALMAQVYNPPTGGGASPGTPAGTIQVYKSGSTFGGTQTWVFEAGVNGAACDHTADETAAFVALVSTVNSAGGGTISYQCNGLFNSAEITIPNNIRITGLVPSANGQWSTPPNTSTYRMDLQFNATDAKLVWLSVGGGEIDHLNLVDTAADCASFILDTNTTLAVHDNLFSGTASGTSACNDAIVMGGTTTSIGNLPADAFQGYGSTIERNFFDKIRRGVYLQVFAQAIPVKDNTWSKTCGGTTSQGAIQVGNSTGTTDGNIFSGNLFETANYPYVYFFHSSAHNNLIFGDTFWDATATTLFAYHFVAGAAGNIAYVSVDATITSAKLADNNQPAGPNAVMDQTWQQGVGLAASNNRICTFASGSGTAQVCNTGVTYTPGTGSIILLSTATANTGTGFTVNVNSLGAKSVAKYSGGAKTTTLAANDIISGLNPMWYDGTNWVLYAPASGSGGSGTTTNALTMNNSGTGDASGSTFNGSAAKTISYNTVGADCALTLTTTGSSGAATLGSCSGGTHALNIPQYAGGSGGLTNITGSSQVTATGCTQSASTAGNCTISGTSTASITFSVIPGSYNNLKLYMTTKGTSGNAGVLLQFNSDTANNYTYQGLNIAGTVVTGTVTTSTNSGKLCSVPASTGLAASCMVTIPNYANTTFPKVTLANGADLDAIASSTNDIYTSIGSVWNNTGAITSVTVLISGTNFANGSIFTLYGEN